MELGVQRKQKHQASNLGFWFRILRFGLRRPGVTVVVVVEKKEEDPVRLISNGKVWLKFIQLLRRNDITDESIGYPNLILALEAQVTNMNVSDQDLELHLGLPSPGLRVPENNTNSLWLNLSNPGATSSELPQSVAGDENPFRKRTLESEVEIQLAINMDEQVISIAGGAGVTDQGAPSRNFVMNLLYMSCTGSAMNEQFKTIFTYIGSDTTLGIYAQHMISKALNELAFLRAAGLELAFFHKSKLLAYYLEASRELLLHAGEQGGLGLLMQVVDAGLCHRIGSLQHGGSSRRLDECFQPTLNLRRLSQKTLAPCRICFLQVISETCYSPGAVLLGASCGSTACSPYLPNQHWALQQGQAHSPGELALQNIKQDQCRTWILIMAIEFQLELDKLSVFVVGVSGLYYLIKICCNVDSYMGTT
ncbi:hypothetical protein AKJ16_DCAP03427, partial [Drosera capensis]